MDLQKAGNPMIITYYPIRAKVQVFRLLCEYLHLQYIDNFINPLQWEEIQKKKDKNMIVYDLPYLQDGDFTITGVSGIIEYIANKAGRPDILGNNMMDQLKIDKFRVDFNLGNKMLSFACSKRKSQEFHQQQFEQFVKRFILPKLIQFQKTCKQNDWFFGYISILDFVVYQTMLLIESFFPDKVAFFPKLIKLQKKVLQIPEIASYENSQRAIKQLCPMKYFNQFKINKIKQKTSGSVGGCRTKEDDMDIEQ